MKKIINNPNKAVQEMTEGIILAYPDKLKLLENTSIIMRKDAPIANKVALISGGGSGHEPAHAGYVGEGMLDAAVLGEVFTSPTVDQVLAAIRAADGGQGVFLIIKNYTGDVLNFEMAAEIAQAEGIEVAQVIVNDDVAVEDSSFTTGRRGIAGTIFAHKIAGAKAEQGAPLGEVKRVAEKTIANVRSMGMAISPCAIPAAGEASFTLKDTEIEIGIGIHGEPGIERQPLAAAEKIATQLMEKILADITLAKNDEVAVLVNGLGATPQMELYIMNKTVQEILCLQGINVYRTFVGNYMTALEMGGCSVTVLKLDDELKYLLDFPADTVNFFIR